MIGLILAIVFFNLLAFKTNKRLTVNQIVHIWMFTIAFQLTFDIYFELKYFAYWYFSKAIDWEGIIPHLVLIPPVNMMFLNWFPFKTNKIKQIVYILLFTVIILLYEKITLLPEPWGYFHYGWWKLWMAVVLDPILLLILVGYYKWILSLEKKLGARHQ